MRRPQRPGLGPAAPESGGRSWRPLAGYLVAALGAAAGGLAALLLWAPTPAPVVADPPRLPAGTPVIGPVAPERVAPAPALPPPPPASASARPAAPAATLPLAPPRDPDGDPTPDIRAYLNPGETPTMGEVINRLQQAGVQGGLGAFSPPGTRPPMVGLAVPEDFVLPEGYVRHHQVTDDGQRLEAVLMFAPGSPLLDPARRQSSDPRDRLVPPELAPPGLPIRRIVVPPPAEPGK
jgi:hypothetical protein